MDELEEIKRKKLMELQNQQNNISQEQHQMQAQIGQLETMIKQFLTKEALQRYGNVKAAHQEKAVQLLIILGQAIQQGQIKEKITDEKLKEILTQLQPEKKEFKIKKV